MSSCIKCVVSKESRGKPELVLQYERNLGFISVGVVLGGGFRACLLMSLPKCCSDWTTYNIPQSRRYSCCLILSKDFFHWIQLCPNEIIFKIVFLVNLLHCSCISLHL